MSNRAPARGRAYRAFKDAAEFGVMTSAASHRTARLVDGPYGASEALERRQSAERHGLQAIVVARYAGLNGVAGWFDVYGRSADEALSSFAAAWAEPDNDPEPLLAAAPAVSDRR